MTKPTTAINTNPVPAPIHFFFLRIFIFPLLMLFQGFVALYRFISCTALFGSIHFENKHIFFIFFGGGRRMNVKIMVATGAKRVARSRNIYASEGDGKMTPSTENTTSIRTRRKREAMLTAAWKVFSEHGYERTSMDMVVAMSGGSKATLYSYFKSKEELLIAAVHFHLMEMSKNLTLILSEDLPLAEALYQFGIQYTKMLLHSDFLEIYRLTAAESTNIPLGAEVFEPGFKKDWDKIAAVLVKIIDPSRLLLGGAWTAAMHLKGLLDSELVLYRLWGVLDRAPNPDLDAHVRASVVAFLRIYAPDEPIPAEFRN